MEDISRKFLLACRELLAPHLSELFNLCIATATFPDILKIAKVVPIYKKGSLREVKNYRPVSTLSNISKIFETLLFKRLDSFIKSKSLLSENQFGFRKGKNTEMAALTLLNRLVGAMKDKKFAVCIFLDFSSCFDTVDRELLLNKLYCR